MQIFKWVPVRIEDQMKQLLENQTSDHDQSIDNNNKLHHEISESQNSITNDAPEVKPILEDIMTLNRPETNGDQTKVDNTVLNGSKVCDYNGKEVSNDKSSDAEAGSELQCTSIVAQPVSSGIVNTEHTGGKSGNEGVVFEELSKVERGPNEEVPAKEKMLADKPEAPRVASQVEEPSQPDKADPEVGEKRRLYDIDGDPPVEEPPKKQTKVTDASVANELKAPEVPVSLPPSESETKLIEQANTTETKSNETKSDETKQTIDEDELVADEKQEWPNAGKEEEKGQQQQPVEDKPTT